MQPASPMVPLFGAAVAGAFLGLSSSLPLAGLAALAVLACLAAVGAHGALARAASLVLVAFWITAAAGAAARETAQSARSSIPEGVVVLEGLIEDVRATSTGGAAFVLSSSGVLAGGAPAPLGLVVQVFAPAGVSVDAAPGDRVRVRGHVRELLPAFSPGEFDGRTLGLARGIDARMSVGAAADFGVVERAARAAVFARLRLALRARMLELLEPRLAGLELALLVGDTSLLDEEQRALYRRAGAGHLLAVSGLQVTLLAVLLRRVALTAVLSTSAGRRGRGRALASGVAFLGVVAFVALCGAPPSAVRAAGMASAVLVAELLGRRVRLLDALGIAGLLTVLLAPASVFDPSFLLSYGAVLGLAASSRPATDARGHATGLASSAAAVVVASVGAGLVTLPLSAALFGEVAPAGVFANIILVPLASALQVPAIGLGLAGALLDSGPIAWLGAQAALLLEATTAGLGDVLPDVQVVTPSGPAVTVSLLAAALVFAVALARRRVVLGSAAVLVAGATIAVAGVEPRGVRITVLPVGQGDAAVVEMPDGRVLVVDGGGTWDGRSDPGTETVLPFLQRRGIDVVDVMVLSHPHPDHALGLVSLAGVIPVRELWYSGAPEGPLLRSLMAAVKGARFVTTPALLGRDRRSWGDASVEVLAPAPAEGTQLYPELGANDNSLVLRVCFRSVCALWPGDIEENGEALLLASTADVRADVVKVPHHGSRTSSTAELIRRAAARHAIFCTGPENTFRFPHREVVERWRGAGARLWDTAVHGELTIRLTDDGVTVEPFVKGDVRSPEDG